MGLPSKYAPDSLSVEDSRKVIVTKDERIRRPPNYIVKTIEKKIDDAVRNQALEEKEIEDIEMVPLDDYEEVSMISDFVNKRRNSQSFMSMEIDEDRQAPEYNETVPVISYLIVDTNFILSHLKIIDRLKDIGEKTKLMIVVPITVMKELDGLKKSDRVVDNSEELSGSSIGHLARWANDWIYSCLASRCKSVKGQSLKERLDITATQDDAILDCALYFKKTYYPSLVVLLSNDKNLCMKALTNEVLTVSYSKNMTAELIAQTISDEVNSIYANIEYTDQVYVSSEKDKMQEERHQIPTDSQDPFSLVFGEIEKLVISIVHQCMINTYGEDIDLVRDYDKSSITGLQDCLNAITRFWVPVFSGYFRQNEFLEFDKKTKKHVGNSIMAEVPQNSKQLKDFVKNWSIFLQKTYKTEMNDTQNEALKSLLQRWLHISESLD